MKGAKLVHRSPFCVPRSERGFTLAEVLTAVLLIIAVLLPLSGVYAAGMALWHGMQQREIASRTLHNTATVLQTTPFAKLLPGNMRLSVPELAQGEVLVTIERLPDLQLVQATVRVSWQSSTGLQKLERPVLISPFGPEVRTQNEER